MQPQSARPSAPGDRDESFWRDYLSNYSRAQAAARPYFSRLPTGPRCQLCGSPFQGFGGRVMRAIGKAQSMANPRLCNQCEKVMLEHHGGAEIPATMLFADIRGSTSIAEGMTPRDFHDLLDRYATVASATVFAHPASSTSSLATRSSPSSRQSSGPITPRAPSMRRSSFLWRPGTATPAGRGLRSAGVHTGRVWFGAVGEGDHVELTALGDPVNVTARLAARAGAGDVLVSSEAAAAAGLGADLPRRSLDLKGRQDPVEVVTLRLDEPSSPHAAPGA